MSVFLRGEGVDLLAVDAADAGFAETRRAWLAPAGALPEDPEADGEVCLVWAAPGGPTEGSVALARIDWIAHAAELVAARAPQGDDARAREALALVVRYAQHELGLETLRARAPEDDAATLALLARLGFARDVSPGDVQEPLHVRRARVRPA